MRKTKRSKKILTLRTLWSVLAVVLGLFVVAVLSSNYTDKSIGSIPAPFMQPAWLDFNNETYTLDGSKVTFMHGKFVPDGIAGHNALLQNQSLSPSGIRGAAILIDNPGGSGNFYYLVGGTLKNGRQVLSDPMPLGDRIEILSVKVQDPGPSDNGLITVNYLDRPFGAPMSEMPSVQKTSKYSFNEKGNLTSILD